MSTAVDIKWSRYIPHVPTPKQHAFLWLDCREAFFGGAAGGGKSDALLMAALQYVDVPGYAAIIFRKSYTDLELPGAILDRAQEWLFGTDAKYDDNDKEFRFPSGAKLKFGYLQKPKDKFRYRSAEFQFIGFDELTDFEETDYLYINSRVRGPAKGPLSKVPLRSRCASNPGGPGHMWAKERFVDGRNPDRVFIPSSLEDNPHIEQEGYEKSLSLLDPVTHAQLRHGDWTVRPPGYWMFDHEHVQAAIEIGAIYDRMLQKGTLVPDRNCVDSGVDYGDYQTVMIPVIELIGDGMYFAPTESINSREDLEVISKDFADTMTRIPWWWRELRYDASFKQSNRTVASMLTKMLGKHNAVRRYGRPNTYPVSFKDYKDLSIRYLRLLFSRSYRYVEDDEPLDRLAAISPQNKTLIKQLQWVQGKEDDPEKMEKGRPGAEDDAVDAAIAAACPLARKHRKLIEQMQQEAKKESPYSTTAADLVEEQVA